MDTVLTSVLRDDPLVVRKRHDPIPVLSPGSNDSRFREPRTVYLAYGYKISRADHTVAGVEYQYSDRLRYADFDKSDASWDTAKAGGLNQRSAAFYEAYLRLLLDKPHLRLVHILVGQNLSTLHPYHIYGIKREGDQRKRKS